MQHPVEQPPPEFVPPEAWPEFGIEGNPTDLCVHEMVGAAPRGLRWGVWPLMFEQYISDTEPDLDASRRGRFARNRLIVWNRVARTDAPKGWRTSWSRRSWRIDGYYRLQPGKDYHDDWHKTARRNLRNWEQAVAAGEFSIGAVTFDEFLAAYKKSTVAKQFGLGLVEALVRRLKLPQTRDHMRFVGVRDRGGNLIAGTGILDSPTHHASMRECPFLLPEARATDAMTGLVDHWYRESLRNGITMQVFTFFWQPGAPKGWKGFSDFKGSFGPTLVGYPRALWRFVPGKLF